MTIENTHRLLSEEGMPLPEATLHGFAAVFVYLLMVVNYQNFGDPFVVVLRRRGWRRTVFAYFKPVSLGA